MEKYYLGLDMGTNSVGWAVTDQDYRLLRAKGKDMWGVRLFEEANTSAERRTYRIARRRRQREKARMGLLREYFAEEIGKVDAGFYARLDDSKFYMEERTESNQQPFALFADSGYTDRDYYRDYPTIFHLRKSLIESDEPKDVRLVYLALANMFKHRGHFLNTSLGVDGESRTFGLIYQEIVQRAADEGITLPTSADAEELQNLLGMKGVAKRKILEQVAAALNIEKKEKTAYQLLCLMCGLSVNLFDLFPESVDEEHKKLSFSFRASNYEELEEEVKSVIGEERLEFVLLVKELHDQGLLQNIMKGHPYLSCARVELYENHKQDLTQFKRLLQKYDKDAYDHMFRTMEDGNYSAYVGSVNADKCIRRLGGKCTQEKFYKNVKLVLSKLPQDDPDVVDIIRKIEAEIFLPKQLTASNGVIPNQVHAKEMKAILNQAQKYLPFLLEKDESGLTVSERILQIFTFHLPYYVGPLGQQYKDKPGYNVWAERKEGGKIYPWNIEQKIDMKETAEKFIARMVRHCTYMTQENALPKQSLLYEKFQVLNELNNLRIYGEKPPVSVKQNIYRELFQFGKKVSSKRLENWLIQNGLIQKGEEFAVSGIDGGFHCSLTSMGKFFGTLGERALYDENREMIEKIIFWGTIYGNDKKFVRQKIEECYQDALSEQEIKRILGFKFEGWGNLSESFLTIEGASKEDGVIRQLIVALWETNDNLMELLSDRYNYNELLNEKNSRVEKALSEWCIEDLDGLYLSAPVKRMVWQTMRIVNEVEKVLGQPPERIFVEVAREKESNAQRKDSRKKKLSDLYSAIRGEERSWKQEIDSRSEQEFRSKKLYLYYLQMGRCMYTGEIICLDDLMNDNLYDIDHIYPRHFIKDDSLENNLVLVKKQVNAHKTDVFPIESGIRERMVSFWKQLLSKGFLTKEKYDRLTRQYAFTQEEKAAFINRQIVETRQGTKAITQILEQAYPDSEIIFSKAKLVSDFRNDFKLYKVRCINDLHHSKDAYLNIVVGNSFFVKFTKDPLHFIRAAEANPQEEENKYNMNRLFCRDIRRKSECAWIAPSKGQTGTIATVRNVMSRNTPLVTRLCKEAHGGLVNKATIWNKKKAQGEGYIPVKMQDERLSDVTKYGGYSSVAIAGYSLVSYMVKGKEVRSLEALPVYLGRNSELTEEKMIDYLSNVLVREQKGKTISNLQIRMKLIPRNALIRYNGFVYWLGGKTNDSIEVTNGIPLCLSLELSDYMKKIQKAVETGYYNEKNQKKENVLSCDRNQKVYDCLLEKCQNGIYKNRLGAVNQILADGREVYCTLNLEQQCYVLMQLMGNFQAGLKADLQLIGGSKTSGKMKISKRISNASEVRLICQSPTGLFEREIDLLRV